MTKSDEQADTSVAGMSYKDLKKKADEFLRLSEEARQREIIAVIQNIRDLIIQYDLDEKDIGFSSINKRRKSSGHSRFQPDTTTLYQSPDGETWNGRGRTPKWMTRRLNEGLAKESFLVKNS